MLAPCRILLKIVIFDHSGHVDDENVNFSKNVGPIQDFAPICHFLRILLKIVICYHRGHVQSENFNFFSKMFALRKILLIMVIFDHRQAWK